MAAPPAGATDVEARRRRPRREGAIHYLVGPDRFVEVQQRAGAAFAGVVVVGVVVAVATADDGQFERPGVVVALAVAAFGWALLTATVGRRRPGWFDTLALGAPLAVDTALYFVGPERQEAATIVAAICAGAAVFIRPVMAVASVALMLGGYLAVLVLGDGYTAPASRFALVASASLAAAGLFLWLFRHLEALALSEREARAKVEAANRTLQQFLSPQVAATVLDGDDPTLLEPHRRRIAVVFVDLRGFTAFTGGAEPEDVVEVLGELYAAFGEEVERLDATFGSYAGDGVMAYFGDPVPCDDPPRRAVELALAVRSRLEELGSRWAARGHRLGHGIGVAEGYATLGIVGHRRREYTPLGSVVNLAARLCAEAGDGEILVDQRTRGAIEDGVDVDERRVVLKGFADPVVAYALR